jgi:hypothetical protein
MKFSWKLTAAIGAILLITAPLVAQTAGTAGGVAAEAAPIVPLDVPPTGGDAEDPFADEAAPIEPESVDVSDAYSIYDNCESANCGGGGGLANMCAGEPCHIWSRIAPNAQECYNLDVGGWVQVGYFTEGKNGFGTGLFNSYPNVVQLQQAWAYVEKAIDDDRCRAFDWGFRLDYVYGTDGPDTQAFGGEPGQFDFGWDNGFEYGHAIPQAYVDLAYNDLKVRFGHFYTICGYEVVPAPDNFFYSHAFTMYLAEPFTHTGVLAEYSLGDNITLWGGWTSGWDTGFTRNGGDIFLGGASLQLTEDMVLTYTTTMGDFGFDFQVGGVEFPGSDQDAYSHSIVFDWQVTEKFNYVIQGDYIDNDLLLFGADPFGFDKAWGVNQYFIYQINDCLGAGVRLEYFDRDAYEIVATTLGVNVKPHANVILRPEVRYEDFDDGNFPGFVDSWIFGMDMIVTF